MYLQWQSGLIGQVRAAELLGISVRTFRRWIRRYREEGLAGLRDRRKDRSPSRATQAEVDGIEHLYRTECAGWSVRHFYDVYVFVHGGSRSYTWVKNCLQDRGLVDKSRRRDTVKSCRSSTHSIPSSDGEAISSQSIKGTLIHQVAFTHEWLGKQFSSLCVTLDSANRRIYSGFLVDSLDIWTAFRGVWETVDAQGLFHALCGEPRMCRRGANSGGVPVAQFHQFRRAMNELGVELAFERCQSSRARVARLSRTLRTRLPKEMTRAGVADTTEANAFLRNYWPSFNRAFVLPLENTQSAFVRLSASLRRELREVFCLKAELQIDHDGDFHYRGKSFRIGRHTTERSLTQGRLRVHEYQDGSFAVFHGRKAISQYGTDGRRIDSASDSSGQ